MRRMTLFSAWGCVIALAVLSLLPAEEMVRTGLSGQLEHAVAYAGTGLLLGLAYAGRTSTAAALAAYAGVLEVLQNFSPGRHPAVIDWLCSSAGGIAGPIAAGLALVVWPGLARARTATA